MDTRRLTIDELVVMMLNGENDQVVSYMRNLPMTSEYENIRVELAERLQVVKVRASQQTSGSDSGPLPKKSNSLPTERDLGRKTQKSSKRSSDGSEQKALPNKRMQGSQTPSSASSSNATSPEGKRSRERRRLHDEDTDRDQSADRGRSGTKSPSKSPKRKQHDQMKGHIKSLSSGGSLQHLKARTSRSHSDCGAEVPPLAVSQPEITPSHDFLELPPRPKTARDISQRQSAREAREPTIRESPNEVSPRTTADLLADIKDLPPVKASKSPRHTSSRTASDSPSASPERRGSSIKISKIKTAMTTSESPATYSSVAPRSPRSSVPRTPRTSKTSSKENRRSKEITAIKTQRGSQERDQSGDRKKEREHHSHSSHSPHHTPRISEEHNKRRSPSPPAEHHCTEICVNLHKAPAQTIDIVTISPSSSPNPSPSEPPKRTKKTTSTPSLLALVSTLDTSDYTLSPSSRKVRKSSSSVDTKRLSRSGSDNSKDKESPKPKEAPVTVGNTKTGNPTSAARVNNSVAGSANITPTGGIERNNINEITKKFLPLLHINTNANYTSRTTSVDSQRSEEKVRHEGDKDKREEHKLETGKGGSRSRDTSNDDTEKPKEKKDRRNKRDSKQEDKHEAEKLVKVEKQGEVEKPEKVEKQEPKEQERDEKREALHIYVQKMKDKSREKRDAEKLEKKKNEEKDKDSTKLDKWDNRQEEIEEKKPKDVKDEKVEKKFKKPNIENQNKDKNPEADKNDKIIKRKSLVFRSLSSSIDQVKELRKSSNSSKDHSRDRNESDDENNRLSLSSSLSASHGREGCGSLEIEDSEREREKDEREDKGKLLSIRRSVSISLESATRLLSSPVAPSPPIRDVRNSEWSSSTRVAVHKKGEPAPEAKLKGDRAQISIKEEKEEILKVKTDSRSLLRRSLSTSLDTTLRRISPSGSPRPPSLSSPQASPQDSPTRHSPRSGSPRVVISPTVLNKPEEEKTRVRISPRKESKNEKVGEEEKTPRRRVRRGSSNDTEKTHSISREFSSEEKKEKRSIKRELSREDKDNLEPTKKRHVRSGGSKSQGPATVSGRPGSSSRQRRRSSTGVTADILMELREWVHEEDIRIKNEEKEKELKRERSRRESRDNDRNLERARSTPKNRKVSRKSGVDKKSETSAIHITTTTVAVVEENLLDRDYRREKEIGRGMFGVVWMGVHKMMNIPVAIKEVDARGNDKDKIMREAEIMKDLEHENIVVLYRSFEYNLKMYFILEFVDSGSLYQLWKRQSGFTEKVVCRFALQTLHGLNYLHSKGIMHRDIKLITSDIVVKLSDFGTSKADDNKSYTVIGSPYWMAPEIIKGSGSTSFSDVWSLGCTVVELMTGKPPNFDLPQMRALFVIVESPIPPIPEDKISPNLKAFLENGCFPKEPNERQPASELINHVWFTTAAPLDDPKQLDEWLKRHNKKEGGEEEDKAMKKRILHRRFKKITDEESQAITSTTANTDIADVADPEKAKKELIEKIAEVTGECDLLQDENKRLSDVVQTNYTGGKKK